MFFLNRAGFGTNGGNKEAKGTKEDPPSGRPWATNCEKVDRVVDGGVVVADNVEDHANSSEVTPSGANPVTEKHSSCFNMWTNNVP